MKKEIYDTNIASYFYIGTVNGNILVISVGCDSPFGYPDVLGKAISEYAAQCDKPEVTVYLHLLSCVGNNEIHTVLFNKENGEMDYTTAGAITEEVPAGLLQYVKEFYLLKSEEILRNSVLSQRGRANALTELLNNFQRWPEDGTILATTATTSVVQDCWEEARFVEVNEAHHEIRFYGHNGQNEFATHMEVEYHNKDGSFYERNCYIQTGSIEDMKVHLDLLTRALHKLNNPS